MLSIIRQISNYNFSSRNGNTIKYIVIHDTGNYKDTARNNSINFNREKKGASAHYFVDDNSIYQVVEDYNASWHCGDGKGKYGITNRNSIGIEMCNSGGYTSEKTINNTLELIRFLMKKYNITSDKVVRHYDASRKPCPKNMMSNNWAKWNEFKNKLSNNNVNNNTNSTNTYIRLLKLTSPLMQGEDVKKIQQKLKDLGHLKDKIDGYYGKNTKNAVLNFQHTVKGLDADGMVGQKTWNALFQNNTSIKKETRYTGIITAKSGLRCRKEPNTNSSIVKTFNYNDPITIIKFINNKKWGYTRLGWVCMDYVKITGNFTV